MIFAIIGTFSAFLAVVYVQAFRRTLKSISELQAGAELIGSGNLDYKLRENKKDEIGELSQTFNQMTTNLRTVTASKTDLEAEIVERKKAEEALKKSEELFSKAFHSISFPVSLARVADNQFVDANEAFLKMIGYNREEVIGHTSKQLNMFPNYAEREESVRKLLRNESVNNQEIDIQTKDGKIIRGLFSVVMVDINNQQHMLSSLVDITERKRLQKELNEYTKNLESLVEQRTKELKDAERLAAIGATAGMVGHDIRNPLQAIVSDVFLIKYELAVSS